MKIKTLQFLALSMALVSLTACSKDEDQRPEVFRRQVDPSLLPVPSCADTSDDGKFETWNSSEDELILTAKTIVNPSGMNVPGFISDIRMPDRRIAFNTPMFQWNASIDTPALFHMTFALVDRDGGKVQAIAYQNIGGSGSETGRRNFVAELHTSALTLGCKRLYYCGFLPVPPPPGSTSLMPIDTMRVLFRGHFDVEVH